MSQDKTKRMEWSGTEPNKIRTLFPLASAAQVHGQWWDQEDKTCERCAHLTCPVIRAEPVATVELSTSRAVPLANTGKPTAKPSLPSGHSAEVQPCGALLSRRSVRHVVCC